MQAPALGSDGGYDDMPITPRQPWKLEAALKSSADSLRLIQMDGVLLLLIVCALRRIVTASN